MGGLKGLCGQRARAEKKGKWKEEEMKGTDGGLRAE
jgi:hypothetical protein